MEQHVGSVPVVSLPSWFTPVALSVFGLAAFVVAVVGLGAGAGAGTVVPADAVHTVLFGAFAFALPVALPFLAVAFVVALLEDD